MTWDLIVKATTPGKPTIRVVDGAGVVDAAHFAERLLAVDLVEVARIVPHDTEPASDTNDANLEVLLALAAHREHADGGHG